jgi:hypothetical protein
MRHDFLVLSAVVDIAALCRTGFLSLTRQNELVPLRMIHCAPWSSSLQQGHRKPPQPATSEPLYWVLITAYRFSLMLIVTFGPTEKERGVHELSYQTRHEIGKSLSRVQISPEVPSIWSRQNGPHCVKLPSSAQV